MSRRRDSERRRRSRSGELVRLAAVGVVCVVAGACARSPAEDIALGETILQMSDAITLLRQESAQMQEEIDSLRTALARQDTLLRRLAATAGLSAAP